MLILCRRVFPEAQMMLSLCASMIFLDLSAFDLIVNSNSCIRAWLMVASTMSRMFEFWQVLKGVDITEVFSPERVTKLCSKYGLIAGDSFDFRDGYDFSDPRTQAMVVRHVMTTEPALVIGSPLCTAFSRIQQLNLHVHGEAWELEFERAKRRRYCILSSV